MNQKEIEWKWETGRCTTYKNKTEDQRQDRQQSPAHSSSVSPGTFLSDIWVYIPQTTSHTVCVAMLAEAAPLTESHSIYLSPPYLRSKTIRAWRRGGGAEGGLGGREWESVEEMWGAWLNKGFHNTTQVHVSTCRNVNKNWLQVKFLNSHASFTTK